MSDILSTILAHIGPPRLNDQDAAREFYESSAAGPRGDNEQLRRRLARAEAVARILAAALRPTAEDAPSIHEAPR